MVDHGMLIEQASACRLSPALPGPPGPAVLREVGEVVYSLTENKMYFSRATCRIWRILYVAVDKENQKNHGDNMT